ncbi:hypothetical protein LguiB_030118 [Lonicera macranthoides]
MEIYALVFLLSASSLIIIPKISNAVAVDTINKTQFLKDNDTIVSSNGTFEMGFFQPGNSRNWHVGIWYKKISVQTVVWVANREIPITNKSESVLKVTGEGILVLVNSSNNIIWFSSNNASRSSPQNPIAQLLDSGNLVVREANDDNPENFIWQSFDYPTDTHLPGMKLGWNFVTGLERYLTSWKSSEDPGRREYTYHCDPRGYPQIILKKGTVEKYRTGPWNGLRFSGRPASSTTNTIYTHKLEFNEKEVYYTFELINNSVISRFVLNQSIAQRWTWVGPTQGWKLYLNAPTDDCDDYSRCGPNGFCKINVSPVCGCMKKFVPKFEDNWAVGDWTGGCVRNKSLNCRSGDAFMKYTHVKLPDTRSSWFNESMSLKECKAVCLRNCSCTAYANLNITDGGSGCLLWFDDLIDIRELSDAGQDMYVRIASTELGRSDWKKEVIIKVSSSLLVGTVLLGLSLMWSLGEESGQDYSNNGSQTEDLELPLFGLSTIAIATNNFSSHNRLGEGGFGPVYKGVLEGREIAVKRLSKTSRQGVHEFKNEVVCIAKLQHRNLVKLLGYCFQGDEKMLIYEYMPNNSLDSFIFDETQRKLLDWPKRFHIINGIARGLLYLHQDSRLRIIHRDLKASNVLLDLDMNPKISDFGMARSFGGNETGANTRRVVGTFGYMAPEYAVDGLFSVKSDVFSFGVLVLEIVSGKRNRGFIHPDHQHNLLGHAWRLHLEGKSLELMDSAFAGGEEYCVSEVLRSIHVGLLCVQQSPEDRPNMSSVVLMLASEGALPQPKQPGFFTERTVVEAEYSSSHSYAPNSINDMSSTLIDGR